MEKIWLITLMIFAFCIFFIKRYRRHIRNKGLYTYATSGEAFDGKIKTYAENKDLIAQIDAVEEEKGSYANPFTDGILMPCCGQKFMHSYHHMKYLEKNPDLQYREDGDINYDQKSRHPKFVDYNNAREVIRQAKNKGLRHVHFATSAAVDDELRLDGYKIHNNGLRTISW